MVDAIVELQAGGVEPDIWKIEGLDSADDCDRVARATRAGGAATRCTASCSAAAATSRR